MNKDKAPIQEKIDKKVAADKSSESKVSKILNVVINVVLIISIIFAAICTYVSFVNTSGNGVPGIFGLRLMSIQTPSMKDTINDGDLVISTQVDPDDLRVKDIITYWTVINGERVLNTHRIVNIYDGDGFLIFETKGDANTSADPLTVHEKEIVGVYRFHIPGVGKVFDYLKTGTGFFVVVVIPVFIFFIYHLVQFFRAFFEYQNVKNRIKFEMERDEADAQAAEKKNEENKAAEMAAMEAELREKLRDEIMADMAKANAPDKAADEEKPAEKVEEKEESTEEVAEKENATEAEKEDSSDK